ncbi:MAG: iron chelate uptake ABC transporter family permease subunit [Actinobacteria bacterium]|nr:iron chelate uptake ABC transporter family permease subunit [Cyanobacteriota bacterium]MCL6087324.1 iron chelate uptake ABC transporter family permease subunit [Actinomycetota bacterium]
MPSRIIRSVIFLLIILIAIIILSSAIGAANLSIKSTVKILGSIFPGLNNILKSSGISPQDIKVIFDIRLPRIFMAIIVGIALSGSGVIFQGIFRNPMADPYIIGVSAGAAFGATIGILFTGNIKIVNISATSFFAFLGAVGTTFLIYNISRIKGKISTLTLLLSGVALSSLLTSIISFMMIFRTHDLAKVYFWIMGGLSNSSWNNFLIIMPVIIIILISSFFFMRDLNVMSLGDERANQLGVQTEKIKQILLILASIMAAAAVSVSGIIGFIGLITPHIMRMIVGPDHKILYPTAVISGGIVLLISDTLARIILTPMEIPVGIITSIIGVPFFIYLLIRSKRQVF